MARYPCPICGDPNAYPLWINKEPPEGCPHDDHYFATGQRSVTNVAQCGHQRRRAERDARWRRLAPECFDANGNMLPGKIGEVLAKAQPHDEPIV